MLSTDVSFSILEVIQSNNFKNESMNTIFSLNQLTSNISNTNLDENINESGQSNRRIENKFDKLESDVMIWFISKGIIAGYP